MPSSTMWGSVDLLLRKGAKLLRPLFLKTRGASNSSPLRKTTEPCMMEGGPMSIGQAMLCYINIMLMCV